MIERRCGVGHICPGALRQASAEDTARGNAGTTRILTALGKAASFTTVAGHEGKKIKERTALMRKHDRRLRRILPRGNVLNMFINNLYERPVNAVVQQSLKAQKKKKQKEAEKLPLEPEVGKAVYCPLAAILATWSGPARTAEVRVQAGHRDRGS